MDFEKAQFIMTLQRIGITVQIRNTAVLEIAELKKTVDRLSQDKTQVQY